jgi:hypothetical protein
MRGTHRLFGFESREHETILERGESEDDQQAGLQQDVEAYRHRDAVLARRVPLV